MIVLEVDMTGEDRDDKVRDLVKDSREEKENSLNRKQNLAFHVVMVMASLYVAMVLTNWGTEIKGIGLITQ